MKDFIALVSGSESLYGLRPDTLNSLVISLLPSVDHAYQEMGELKSEESCEIKHFILREIVQALRCNTGLFIPKVLDGCGYNSQFKEIILGKRIYDTDLN